MPQYTDLILYKVHNIQYRPISQILSFYFLRRNSSQYQIKVYSLGSKYRHGCRLINVPYQFSESKGSRVKEVDNLPYESGQLEIQEKVDLYTSVKRGGRFLDFKK